MNYKTLKYGNMLKFTIAAAAIFLSGLYLFFNLFGPADNFPAGKIVKIEKGLGLNEIAAALEKEGAVRFSFAFKIAVIILGDWKTIKAGDYLFDRPYFAFDIAKKVATGDYGAAYTRILIKEGDTLEDIGQIFEKEALLKKEELFAVTGCCAGKILPKSKNDLSFFFQPPIPSFNPQILEGFLFPDTYFFAKYISAEDAVKTILENFNQKFNKALSNLDVGHQNYEILIMASILEKEAVTEKDKRIVSDILRRRLAEKMPLQVDATLQYISGRNTFELTKDDLLGDSAYNTYKYEGLPPTPISNPGIESINAAVSPLQNDYWYYLSDKKGEIHYSKTFKEHKLKKSKYLE